MAVDEVFVGGKVVFDGGAACFVAGVVDWGNVVVCLSGQNDDGV